MAVVSLDELLRAVADGRVSRVEDDEHRGFWALYQLDDGTTVERWSLNMLRKRALIDLPMLGPPTITPDGVKHLTATS